MKTLAKTECRAELLRRLKTLTADSPRRWGRMSAHQMICHLNDACRMAIGGEARRIPSHPLRRLVVKWMALYAPLPWPPGIPTTPEIDQESGGTRPGDFASDLATLETLLGEIAQPRSAWPSHPIFGRMSPRAWLRWAYLHTDHHLRQFGA